MHLSTNTHTCMSRAPAAELHLPAEGGVCVSADRSCPVRPRCVSQNTAPLPAIPAGAVPPSPCPQRVPVGAGDLVGRRPLQRSNRCQIYFKW